MNTSTSEEWPGSRYLIDNTNYVTFGFGPEASYTDISLMTDHNGNYLHSINTDYDEGGSEVLNKQAGVYEGADGIDYITTGDGIHNEYWESPTYDNALEICNSRSSLNGVVEQCEF